MAKGQLEHELRGVIRLRQMWPRSFCWRGVDIRFIQALLGHVDGRTTEFFTQFTRAIMSRLNEL